MTDFMAGGAVPVPILTAALGLANVRIFAPQLPDALPEIALEDLFAALGVSESKRAEIRQTLLSFDQPFLQYRQTVALVPLVAAMAFVLHGQKVLGTEGMETLLMRAAIDAFRSQNPSFSIDGFMAVMNNQIARLARTTGELDG